MAAAALPVTGRGTEPGVQADLAAREGERSHSRALYQSWWFAA